MDLKAMKNARDMIEALLAMNEEHKGDLLAPSYKNYFVRAKTALENRMLYAVYEANLTDKPRGRKPYTRKAKDDGAEQ